MKTTREIFKVNGKTFTSMDEVYDYCDKKQFHITNKTTTFEKRINVTVTWIDVQSY